MNNTILRHIEQRSAAEAFRWSFSKMETELKKKSSFTVTDFPAGSAAVVIIERDGQVLAVSRRDNHADLGLPGGKIEPGESPITAACREAAEELGATVCNPMLASIADVGGIAVFIYRAELIGALVEHVNSEGARVCWTYPQKICQGSFGKFNKKHVIPLLA